MGDGEGCWGMVRDAGGWWGMVGDGEGGVVGEGQIDKWR